MTLALLSADTPVEVLKETERNILLSCHSALLRLGDLYRYRNDLNTKQRSWVKATAHYALANDLHPDAGSAFNQMAVISLADGNHLDAVYNLYRALAVKEPHTLAESNLAIEFKKINTLWHGTKKSASAAAPKTPAASMVLWFVRLHARLYKGEEFSNHDELENEVLSQMTVLLKEQSLEGILDKVVLINIAAEYVASIRYEGKSPTPRFHHDFLTIPANQEPSSLQAYLFYLRLNVRTIFMLLQLLQPELDYSCNGQDAPDVTGKKQEEPPETITAVTRRILPALRHYSTWLVATAPVIVTQSDSTFDVHIKEMWSMYCTTLNLLLNAFPKSLESCEVDYLLEEDAATVGFKPFKDSPLCRNYHDADGRLKRRTTDLGVSRHHPNVEMFARIKGLLQDGVDLAQMEQNGRKTCPIAVVDGEFRFCEDGVPHISPSPTPGRFRAESQFEERQYDHRYTPDVPTGNGNTQASSVDPSESQQSISHVMHQMVEDLLTPSKMPQPTQPSAGGNNGTPYRASKGRIPDSLQAPQMSQSLNQHHLQSKVFGLPGFTSAFAPRPGELGTSTSPSMARNPLNNRDISDSSLRFDRPLTPSQMDLPPPPYLQSWQMPQQPSSAPVQHTQQHSHSNKISVAQELQQALSSQFLTPGFSNQSSIYQNSPGFVQPPPGFPARHGVAEQNKQTLLDAALWNQSPRAVSQSQSQPQPHGQYAAVSRRNVSAENGHLK